MADPDEPTDEQQADFEEKIAALLKVDPKGIAGKHRKDEIAEGPAM